MLTLFQSFFTFIEKYFAFNEKLKPNGDYGVIRPKIIGTGNLLEKDGNVLIYANTCFKLLYKTTV